MSTEKIIEKVKKLLALSTSSNPHEAALAAAKAQSLLLQHNLIMEEVKAKSGQKSAYTAEVTELCGRSNWMRMLLCVIAQHSFCAAFLGPDGAMRIVGEAHNLEVVRYLFVYLCGEINRLSDIGYKVVRTNQGSRSWKNSFKVGAVSTIGKRLEEDRIREKAAANTCRALVVVKDHELAEAVKDLLGRTTNTTFRTKLGGYEAGASAARDIPLHKGVNGGTERGRLS